MVLAVGDSLQKNLHMTGSVQLEKACPVSHTALEIMSEMSQAALKRWKKV